jgi:Tfp pilus assembly protein PilF
MTRVFSLMTRLAGVVTMLAASLIAGVPAAAAAPAAPGARVLVMPFSVHVDAQNAANTSASLWLGEAAAILVGDELNRQGLTAISRDESVVAFDRLQLPRASTLTRATMIRVGELLGASDIVFGDIGLGAQLSVRAHVIQMDGAKQSTEIADRAGMEDLFPLFERVSDHLAPLTGRPTGVPGKPAVYLPRETFENYVKGLVAGTPAAQQRFLESALKQAPGDARVLVALWSTYTSQGLHDRALAVASAVPKDSPLSRKARFAAALSLIDLGRFDGAFQELTTLYKERPAATLSNALGIVQLRRGGVTDPAQLPTVYFKRAVDAEPGNTDYLFNLGYANALGQNQTAAVSWLREAVRYDAANGDAHLVMSAVLAATGKPVEAQREFDLAKQLGTKPALTATAPLPKVPAGLERVRTDLDMISPTLVDVASGPQNDQAKTAAFHLDQGRKLYASNSDRDATNELKRAIYLAPYEDEPHLLLGRIYERGGRLADAIDEFKVAIWCKETAAARVALGTALLESGDKDAAKREGDRALILDPQSADARALLRRIGG